MFEKLELGPNRKAQAIDSDLLQPPLRAIPDNPDEGGTEGHVAIVPVTSQGQVDQELLEEWAATRRSGQTHQLTQMLLDAVVEVNIRG
jgi:hypothetical protein